MTNEKNLQVETLNTSLYKLVLATGWYIFRNLSHHNAKAKAKAIATTEVKAVAQSLRERACANFTEH